MTFPLQHLAPKNVATLVTLLLILPGTVRSGYAQPVLTSEQAIARTLNTLTASSDGFHLQNPRHHVDFAAEGIRFQPELGGPAWRWRLTHIGAGAYALPRTHTDAVQPQHAAHDVVAYDRGALTEQFVLHAHSIEQQFVLSKPLPLDGQDLVIEGAIESEGAFETQARGWLWRTADGVVRLGQVFAYDAMGTPVPARLQVTATTTRLTVDGAALSGAVYPVVIDPEIGTGDFRISDMGPDGDASFQAFEPAVAYNPDLNEYLVVWRGDDLFDDEHEIFGQRLDATTGAEVGANDFRISDMGLDGGGDFFFATNPAVVYNPDRQEYLVVWDGVDLVFPEFEIYGQRLDAATGAEVGTNDFPISDVAPAGDASEPAVTYNPDLNEYLVVWEGDESLGDGQEIFGQRLDGVTGADVGANDFLISDMGPNGNASFQAREPAVAYNADEKEYLVVWPGDDLFDDEFEIFGQRLDAATGAEVGANDFRISDMGPDGDASFQANAPAVVYNADEKEYLVVWQGDDLVDNEFEIYGQRLDAATGAELGTNDFRISDMGPDGNASFHAFNPAVVYNAGVEEYLVVWLGDDLVDGEGEIYGQRLDAATGAELGTNDFRISDMGPDGDASFDALFPAVAYNADEKEYLIVWPGDDLVDEEFEIFGQQLDATTGAEVILNDFRISDRGKAEASAVVYNAGRNEYLTVWQGDRLLNEQEIFGRRLETPNGVTSLTATDDVFEDRVELSWEIDSVAPFIHFEIARDDTLLGVTASGRRSYLDATATIDVEHTYCIVAIDDIASNTVCDTGRRVFRVPSGFQASDATRETDVRLSWTDNSGIEDGFRIIRTPKDEPPDTTFEVSANASSFLDVTAVINTFYSYCLTAFTGTNETVETCDIGRRALVTPPAGVQATDGIYTDRVQITWTDQSDKEDGYLVFRDAVSLDTTDADVMAYVDFSATFEQDYTYCVAALVGTDESGLEVPGVCDGGRAGGLVAPTDVAAAVDLFDDRVAVNWAYDGPTVDRFEVFRDGDADPLGTSGSISRTYNDFEAVPGQNHTYCVTAVSEPADATGPSTSAQACTASPGRRAFVLTPTDAVASEGAFEDRVELSWASPSTTVMLFNVYRGQSTSDTTNFAATTLIATTAFDDLAYLDELIESDVTYDYCVTAVTVSSSTAAARQAAVQAEIQRAVAAYLASETEREATAQRRPSVSMLQTRAEALQAGAMRVMEAYGVTVSGLEESGEICTQGWRSLVPPGGVAATLDEEENHVEVTWVDASGVEKGYRVYRGAPTLSFDGTDDGIAVPDADAINTAAHEQRTVEAWFYVQDASITSRKQAIWEEGAGGNGLVVYVYNGRLYAGAWSDRDLWGAGLYLYTDAITAQTWHHVALVLDGPLTPTPSGQTLTGYLDGVVFGADSDGNMSEFSGHVGDIGIGFVNGDTQFHDGDFVGEGHHLAGLIRDVRVWNTARTEDQILAEKDRTLDGDEPGLVANWLLDEGSGSTAFDGVSGFDAPIAGATWTVGEELVGETSAGLESLGDYNGMPGVEYTYRVRTFDEYLDDTFSESQNGSYEVSTDSTGRRRLEAPTLVQAGDGASETVVEITWSDESRAETGYEVLRDGAVIAMQAANAQSYIDTAPTFGTTHTYGVRAIDASGASSKGEDDGGTDILPPASVSASEVYDTEVVLAWVDVSGVETGYEVKRDDVVLATLPANATTYTDATATAGVTYAYCVTTLAATATSEAACDDGGIRTATPIASGSGIEIDATVDPQDDVSGDIYGADVAADGDYVAVAAFSGIALYIFKRDGDDWVQQEKLAVGSINSVDMQGEYVVFTDNNGVNIAKRSGTSWSIVQTIAVAGQTTSISIDGDYIAVHDDASATPSDDRVTIYKLGNDTWLFESTFRIGDANHLELPSTLALSGNYLVVGDWKNGGGDSDASVGVWERSGTSWSPVQTLLPDPAPGDPARDNFGVAVDIDGNYIVVADPSPTNGGSDGYAYVFELVDGMWEQHAKFASEDNPKTPGFAGTNNAVIVNEDVSSISINGNYFAVPDLDDGESGTMATSAYVYRLEEGTWSFKERIFPSSSTIEANSNGINSAAISAGGDLFPTSRDGADSGFSGLVYHQALPVRPASTSASDGLYDDRIQVRWTDTNRAEDGYNVYRREDGGALQLIDNVGANVTVFNDFSAAPGNAYAYCVKAFVDNLVADGSPLAESLEDCDFGWRSTNGVIAGRVATQEGGGTKDVAIQLDPPPNNALLFDGEAGRVPVPDANAINNADHLQRTVEVWFYVQDPSITSRKQTIWEEGDTFNGLAFYVYAGQLYAGAWSNKDGWGAGFYLDTDAITAQTWHHVALVVDGPGKTVTGYFDGAVFGTDGSSAMSRFPRHRGNIGIGYVNNDTQFHDAEFEGEGHYFAGMIDDVRVWNTARTQADIQAARLTPLTGEEEDLVGYWPLDQGARAVAPDLTETAAHGELIDGVYWSDEAAPLEVAAATDVAGNYTFSGLRYGSETTFTVTPTLGSRTFDPVFKTITLSTDNPVQNEVDFTDESAFTVAGRILFENTVCPVEDVELYVKEVLLNEEEIKSTSEADGTFAVATDPSNPAQPGDLRRIIPRLSGRTFLRDGTTDDSFTYFADQDTAGVLFHDQTTQILSGFYGGGGPTCNQYVGDLTVHITTEDGCFSQDVPLASIGNYDIELPPQKYLVSVEVDLNTVPTDLDVADVFRFFDNLGQQAIDLTAQDDTLDFIYHAPLAITILGLPDAPAACAMSGFTVVDSDTDPPTPLRALPNVSIVEEFETLDLTISVAEDYGAGGTCPVEEGVVTILDAISDAEDPVVLDLEDGQASYTTFGRSPDVFAGRFVDGQDRSFQKSLTVIAEVEGRDPTIRTDWVVVEGFRERTASFVSATTDEFPLLILHDPPGSQSYAYLEEGSTTCNRIANLRVSGTSAGAFFDVAVGFKAFAGGPFFKTETGAGVVFTGRTVSGQESSRILKGKPNREICVTTTEQFTTSDDPSTIRDDVFVGVALNLIFAKSDVLDADEEACTIERSEGLAADLDPQKTFETTYVYNESFIGLSIIPDLEDLVELADSNTVLEGDLDGERESIGLSNAIANWEDHLALTDSLTMAGLESDVENRSFSGGNVYEYTQTTERTEFIRQDITIDFGSGDTDIGVIKTIGGYDQQAGISMESYGQTINETDSTVTESRTVGYVFDDGDGADLFTVDVGSDPVYDTFVFETLSGRSSNPCEPGTQCRDKPVIDVSPPVQFGVDPDDLAVFILAIGNDSESGERREYVLAAPGQHNPDNAILSVTGDILGGARLETFLVDAGTVVNINLSVGRGPSVYTYDSLAVILYPEDEYNIWRADTRQPFALSDTAWFSVQFQAPCTEVSLLQPDEFWTFQDGDTYVPVLIADYDLDPDLVDGDLSQMRIGAQYRRINTADWIDIPASVRTGDVLEAEGASSIFASWTPPRDGTYELRAFSQCGGTENMVASPKTTGIVDTTPLVVFGTPEPRDGSLALGDDASVTFREALDCKTINDETGTANVQIGVLDDNGDVSATLTDIEALCDGRSVLIRPQGDWDETHEGNRYEVRILADQAIVPTDELGNEIPSDIAWQFIVQRSGFSWNPVNLVVVASRGVERVIETSLTNGNTDEIDVTIDGPFTLDLLDAGGDPTGTTVDLDPSVDAATLPAGGSYPVQFTIPDTLALGTWSGQIEATASQGGGDLGTATFFAEVNVACAAPAWTVDPAAFEYTMSLTAQLFVEGIASTDENDFVAAYVNGQVRGVGQNMPVGGGAFRVTMLLYSNDTLGEVVTFQVWDDDQCTLYDETSLAVSFLADTGQGTLAVPVTLEAPPPATTGTTLAAGWTWFSINTVPVDATVSTLFAGLGTVGDIVKSQTEFSQFDETLDWVGSLISLEAGEGYLARLGRIGTLEAGGPAVPFDTPIALDAEWNWIGYQPQEAQALNGAFDGTFGFVENDLIKSQFAFAQYDGIDWVGSLTELEPGQSYQLQVATAGTLVYSDPNANVLARVFQADAERLDQRAGAPEEHPGTPPFGAPFQDLSRPAALETAEEVVPRASVPLHLDACLLAEETEGIDQRFEPIPGRTLVPGDYTQTMTLTATLSLAQQTLSDETFCVTVRAGDELRGLGRLERLSKGGSHQSLVFLTIYGSDHGGEMLTLEVHKPGEDEAIGQTTGLVYQANRMLGTPNEPAEIVLESTTAVPTVYELSQNYPNPFNPLTTIGYAVPQAGEVKIELFDVLGRRVALLVNGEHKPGQYQVQLDASRLGLASGMYLYRMQVQDFREVRKMTLIK